MSFIVKPGANTATYPTADSGNMTEATKTYLVGSAAAWALKETSRLYKQYLDGPFKNWLQNYKDWIVNEPPPTPSNGRNAEISDDGISSVGLVDSGVPCGPIPSYEKRQATPSGPLRTNVPVAPALLIGKIGDQVEQFDGTVWQRVK